MSGIDRGPGVLAKEQQEGATPETGEMFVPFPDGTFPRSVTFEEVGAADGQHKALRIFVYDKARNVTMTFAPQDGPDGGDFFFPSSAAPAPTPSGLIRGFDIGFPSSDPAKLIAVAQALGATWCGLYLGGVTYGGTWTPELARGVAPVLPDGFAPLWVGPNIVNGALQGMLDGVHGTEAGNGAMQAAIFQYHLDSGTIFFDVEANTWAAYPNQVFDYIDAAANTIANSGNPWRCGVYGSRACLNALTGSGLDIDTWLAAWDGIDDVEGFAVHQYHGSTTVAGVGVDLNVAQSAADFGFSHIVS